MVENENNVIAKVKEYHEELKQIHSFVSERLLPMLDIKLKEREPNDKDMSLRDTFIRMYLVIGSILKLNHYKDFHVLASITRTLFELYIDMHLLNQELIPNGLKKFANFTEAKKFSIAEARRNWAMEKKFPFDEKCPQRAEYLRQNQVQNMPKKIKELWGRQTCPNHWSGLSLADRVGKLGTDFIEMYIKLYDLGNWYTHSGPLDWQFLGDGTITNAIAGLAYGSASKMLRECCNICVSIFNLNYDRT